MAACIEGGGGNGGWRIINEISLGFYLEQQWGHQNKMSNQ
jgi:hypothetical protein